jgi:hypothetical protein
VLTKFKIVAIEDDETRTFADVFRDWSADDCNVKMKDDDEVEDRARKQLLFFPSIDVYEHECLYLRLLHWGPPSLLPFALWRYHPGSRFETKSIQLVQSFQHFLVIVFSVQESQDVEEVDKLVIVAFLLLLLFTISVIHFYTTTNIIVFEI